MKNSGSRGQPNNVISSALLPALTAASFRIKEDDRALSDSDGWITCDSLWPMMLRGEGWEIVNGVTVFVEPDVPLTLTPATLQDQFYGTLDPIVFQSIRVTTLDRETLATLSTPWDCRQLVLDAAGE